MAAPPVFWIHEREDYAGWLRQPDHAAWLAYKGAEPVGCLGLQLGHGTGCEIVQDEKMAYIAFAFTRQDARCRGIASALLNQALAWAGDRGCERCAVDWETMNVPANRFWTRRFDAVCYSLVRWLDDRIVARSSGRGSRQDGQPVAKVG